MDEREKIKAAVLEGLEAGRTLTLHRKDDPVLEIVMELQEEGKCETRLHQIDEQSSVVKVRKEWNDGD